MGKRRGVWVGRPGWEPGAADVLGSLSSFFFSFPFPFPRRAEVGRYLWRPGTPAPAQTVSHKSELVAGHAFLDTQLHPLLPFLGAASTLLQNGKRYLKIKINHTLNLSSIGLQRSSNTFHNLNEIQLFVEQKMNCTVLLDCVLIPFSFRKASCIQLSQQAPSPPFC